MGSALNLSTEKPSLPGSVGVESGGGGDRPAALDIRILDPRVEFMRFCEHCQEERQFTFAWFSLAGLIGSCLWCGTPDAIQYTRTNSEAA